MLCGEVGSRVTSCGGPSGAANEAHHLTLLNTAGYNAVKDEIVKFHCEISFVFNRVQLH